MIKKNPNPTIGIKENQIGQMKAVKNLNQKTAQDQNQTGINKAHKKKIQKRKKLIALEKKKQTHQEGKMLF